MREKRQGPTRAAVLSGAVNVAIFVSAPQFYCFTVNAPLRFCICHPVFFLYEFVFLLIFGSLLEIATNFLKFACNCMY